jgi:hypothetical protein
VEWSSKSTLLAVGVALVVAGVCAAALSVDRSHVDPSDRVGGNLLALIAAVVAGLVPVFLVRGFPLTGTYMTRFFLPVLVFANCATVAGLLYLIRPRYAPLILFAVIFLSADRLILGAIQERRLQSELEHIGERLRPLVQEEGLVVVVSPTRPGISPEERMAKETYSWPYPQAGRLWVLRAPAAEALFGPRSGCRSVESLHLEPRGVRLTRADEPIRLVLWDASPSDEPDLEPYFRGCRLR